ncbi:SulP family inorganic anion transporter [Glaciecola sp. 1036]|uniref:SulP family inorganic anion transporter n=1 Tax=Alteromonadaceae TaxID=72275 RepID=UPI003D087C01
MYSRQDFTRNISGDLFGGITAAIVALPLALAFGISSGAGPIAGLYGAIIVGLFASIFGGTPSQISGPTGPMTVVMTAIIAQTLATYPQAGLTLAFTTVLLGGLLQALFGLLRLGKYIVTVPYPVISGFMSGVGVIIIILELGPMLGFSPGAGVLNSLENLPLQIKNLNAPALYLGLISLLIVFLWRGKANRLLPAPLLALLLTTMCALWLDPSAIAPRIGIIPSALPELYVPKIEFEMLQFMLMNALMLAVLGSIDSLLTSLVADNATGTQHNSDKELIGQGIGNAFAGLFAGLPGAGATMRTMVNIRAGGTGPLSGVVHSLILAIVIAGAGFLFENIPLAALAGILLKVGIDIIDWPFVKRLHQLPKFPVFLMLLVFGLTVLVDLITAVFVGVFIKNIVILNQLSDIELGRIIFADTTQGLDRLRKKEQKLLQQQQDSTVLIRITGPVSYAVGRGLKQQFEPFKTHQVVLIDVQDASLLGISTGIVIEGLIRYALENDAQVKLIGVEGQTGAELKRLGIVTLVGEENCYSSLSNALEIN